MAKDPCVKKSISMPSSYYELANIRIREERLKGLTDYIQKLIREDTDHLVRQGDEITGKSQAATKANPAPAKKAPKIEVAGAKISDPSEISDGGPSTHKKGTSLKTG